MNKLHLNISQSVLKFKFIDIEADSFEWKIVSMKSEKKYP